MKDFDGAALARRLMDGFVHRGHASCAEPSHYTVVPEPPLLHVPGRPWAASQACKVSRYFNPSGALAEERCSIWAACADRPLCEQRLKVQLALWTYDVTVAFEDEIDPLADVFSDGNFGDPRAGASARRSVPR